MLSKCEILILIVNNGHCQQPFSLSLSLCPSFLVYTPLYSCLEKLETFCSILFHVVDEFYSNFSRSFTVINRTDTSPFKSCSTTCMAVLLTPVLQRSLIFSLFNSVCLYLYLSLSFSVFYSCYCVTVPLALLQ